MGYPYRTGKDIPHLSFSGYSPEKHDDLGNRHCLGIIYDAAVPPDDNLFLNVLDGGKREVVISGHHRLLSPFVGKVVVQILMHVPKKNTCALGRGDRIGAYGIFSDLFLWGENNPQEMF